MAEHPKCKLCGQVLPHPRPVRMRRMIVESLKRLRDFSANPTNEVVAGMPLYRITEDGRCFVNLTGMFQGCNTLSMVRGGAFSSVRFWELIDQTGNWGYANLTDYGRKFLAGKAKVASWISIFEDEVIDASDEFIYVHQAMNIWTSREIKAFQQAKDTPGALGVKGGDEDQ